MKKEIKIMIDEDLLKKVFAFSEAKKTSIDDVLLEAIRSYLANEEAYERGRFPC